MPAIGKTIDQLEGFSGTPSLGSLFAIRDMTLASSDPNATKKFSIADFIILIHSQRENFLGSQTLTAGNPTTVLFPAAFAETPEVGVVKTLQGGVHVGIGVDISSITNTGFVATALEDCTLIYLAGKVIPIS